MKHNKLFQWRVPNAEQREQYWIGKTALIAHMDSVILFDDTQAMELQLDVVAGVDFLTFHYYSDEIDFDMSLSKPIAGLAQEQCAAEDIFRTRIHCNVYEYEGFKLDF